MNMRNIRNTSFIIHLLLSSLFFLFAEAQNISQVRRSLEEQRNQLQRDIERVSEGLKEVQSSRHQTLTQLNVLQNKLELRNKLIKNINTEINYINNDINKSEEEIKQMQGQLDTLRAEYAKMVVYAYKNRHNYNTIYFLLSADSFNDAIKRFQYLKQYREYRDHEAKKIIKTQEKLKLKLDTLKNMKGKRRNALVAAKKQRSEVI